MTASLEEFLDRFRSANPFLSNRVSRPAAGDVDVHGIHDTEFRKLLALAQQACDLGQGLGAVVWGDAGAGKSHLLARLGRWIEQQDGGCFIYLYNLQARAERLPRYILKCVLSVLTHGRQRAFHGCRLYGLVRSMLHAALPDAAARRSLAQLVHAHGRLLDRLAARDPARVDRDVFQVLLRFYVSANVAHHARQDDGVAALAVRWLSGDALDADEARRLGLRPQGRPGDLVALADDEQVKLVLVALTHAARLQQRPFLLCFDQPAENAEPEQVAVLTRFLHDLIDGAVNLLVVTASVEGTLRRYRAQGHILEPAWHRLAQFPLRLRFLARAEARAVLDARLRHFLEPFRDLPELREPLARDPLFPLGSAWLDERLRDRTELRPRQVIDWARERWESQQEALAARPLDEWLANWPRVETPPPQSLDATALLDARVEQALAAHVEQRRQAPATLPADASSLAGLLHALLTQGRDGHVGQAGVETPPPARPGAAPTYDLIVRHRQHEGREARLGVLCLVSANATSTAAFLRRLVEDAQPPERVLLVTDARQPLQLGAAGRDYLTQLQERGERFHHVELSFAEYAALEALQATVNQARAGDLAIDLPDGQTHPVSAAAVVAAHARHGRYQAQPLLRLLFPPADAFPPGSNGVADPAVRIKTLDFIRIHETAVRQTLVAQLALTTEASLQELVARCRRTLDVDEATGAAAVREVLGRMEAEGLVRVEQHGSAAFFSLC